MSSSKLKAPDFLLFTFPLSTYYFLLTTYYLLLTTNKLPHETPETNY